MPTSSVLRAVLCQIALGGAVAIAIVACGGAVEPSADATPTNDADGAKRSPPVAACTASCVPTPIDASAPRCIEVDPSSFDGSCSVDAECTSASGGTFCDGTAWCSCAFASIGVKEKARYEALMERVRTELTPGQGGCFCPYFGKPTCVAGRCTLCGGASPACTDGG